MSADLPARDRWGRGKAYFVVWIAIVALVGWGIGRWLVTLQASPRSEPQTGAGYLVAVGNDHVNFGSVDPYGPEIVHRFRVRNRSTARVQLVIARKSCNCTHVTISPSEIAGGEDAEVFVKWRPPESSSHSSFVVEVAANDVARDQQVGQVTVSGEAELRWRVTASPASVQFGALLPGESRDARVTLHSTAGRRVRVRSIEVLDQGETGAGQLTVAPDPEYQNREGTSVGLLLKMDGSERPGRSRHTVLVRTERSWTVSCQDIR